MKLLAKTYWHTSGNVSNLWIPHLFLSGSFARLQKNNLHEAQHEEQALPAPAASVKAL